MSNRDEGPEMGRINLLLSILIRYPQINTIKYLEEGTCRFSFLYKQHEDLEVEKLSSQICGALDAHGQLLGERPQKCELEFKPLGSYGRLDVVRDLKTLSQPELSLLTNLVREGLGSQLIVENQELGEEELIFQDQIITQLLEEERRGPRGNTLSGLRENGHVLVFNHDDLEFGR